MKKFKKYLFMIPLLAVMLLNCVCYGQVIAADEAIDYSVYHRSADDSPIKDYFDITDVDSVVDYVRNFSQNNSEYYFYSFYLHYNDDIKYSCGEKYSLWLDFSFISDYSGSTEDDNYYIVPTVNFSVRFLFTVDPSTSSFTPFIGNGNPFGDHLIYYKNTGSFDINTTLYYNSPFYNLGHYHYFQYTNIPDFPLFNSVTNDVLDVNVTFSPEFNGEISRTVKANGTTTTLETFNMTVTNNSKFNIQYLMAIYPSSDYFSPFQNEPGIAGSWAAATPNGKTYVGNPTYVYVKDEWIYLPHGEQGVITGYAPSSWHYLNSGATDDVTIYFNQLKLDHNTIYEVSVYAVRNDYDYVSPYTDLASFQWGSDYCIDSTACERVYDSVFRLLNPATFNPNNNEGSYAFDVDDTLLFNRANGYIDENGEVVIDRVDTNHLLNAGTDPDDPWRGWNDDDSAWEVYNKNQNTVSSDISQLSNNFGSFFRFINKVYSYFPKNYQTTITLGLTAVVVIAILKVVF